MSVLQNKGVAERLFEEVFNHKRPEVLEELLDDNVVDHNKIIFAQPEGPGGVQEGVRMLLRAFPDFSVTIERLVGEDDYVVAQLQMAGTNTGPYRGLPEPTGWRAEWRAFVLLRIEAGKIVELWGTADRMSMLTQLGILPDIG